MGFSIQCFNKGCNKLQEPYIDKDTNKAHCSECDKELPNISSFAINQMKANKQYKQKKAVSFSVKCTSCGKEDRPKILNKKICCITCEKEITSISEPFKIMLFETLKTVEKDV